jgi:hypothetical protein
LTATAARSFNLAMHVKIPARLAAISAEALSFVARDKGDTMAPQWLGGTLSAVQAQQWPVAQSLAMELALSVPSMMGTTAFDRLAGHEGEARGRHCRRRAVAPQPDPACACPAGFSRI